MTSTLPPRARNRAPFAPWSGWAYSGDSLKGPEDIRDGLPLRFDKKMGILPVEAKGEWVGTQGELDLPQGTLDLLILKTVALGPQHGWAISERIRQISSAALRVQQGSLYPALHRLERRGWIKARWGTSDNNRRAKFYALTRTGRKQLELETDAWLKLTAAVSQVLDMG
jgi:PadR family transcriptional regulator PadR